MSQHLDGTLCRPTAQSGAMGSLDSNEELAMRGDAFGYEVYDDEEDGEGEESDTPPDPACDARDVVTQRALHSVQQMYAERTGKPIAFLLAAAHVEKISRSIPRSKGKQ